MLKGEKVILRLPDSRDSEVILRWWTDIELNILSGWVNWTSIPHLKERIQRRISEPREDLISMVIEVSETPVGMIELGLIDWRDRTGEIGIVIEKPHWNKGYGKDAVITFMQYLFHIKNFHKISAKSYDFNRASQALFRSIGFVQEGVLRKQEYASGASSKTSKPQ